MSFYKLAVFGIFVGTLFSSCFSGNPGEGSSIVDVVSKKENSTGNGDYYGGKPEPGEYIRIKAPSSCAPLKSFGELSVTEHSVSAKVLDASNCALVESPIGFDVVDYVSYQPDLLGFSDGIYVKKVNDKDQKGEVEETWCRREDSNKTEGFDVVVRADYNAGTFKAYLVLAEKNSLGEIETQAFPPVTIVERRIESFERVRYRSDEFQLEIRTTSFDAWKGKMKAAFRYRGNGLDEEATLDCRVGGELDINSSERGYDL